MNNIVLNKLLTILLLMAGVVFLYLGTIKLFFLLLPFIVGYFVSKLVRPFVFVLHKKLKVPNGITSIFLILGVIAFSSYMIYLIAIGLIFLVEEFATVLPRWANLIVEYGLKWSDKLQDFYLQLPFDPAKVIADGAAGILSQLGQAATKIGSWSISFAKSLPAVLIGIVVTILSAFFFTKDRKLIEGVISPYTDRFITHNKYWQTFKKDVLLIVWGYIKAQLILMSITFVVSAVGLLIIGVPNAPLIALGIGLVDVLPLFGPAAVYMPWVITAFFLGQSPIAIKLLILYAVTTVTRQLLEPKVVGHQIGIHPLLSLAGLYLGVRLLGIPGLILGPFTMVTLVTLYKRYHITHPNPLD